MNRREFLGALAAVPAALVAAPREEERVPPVAGEAWMEQEIVPDGRWQAAFEDDASSMYQAIMWDRYEVSVDEIDRAFEGWRRKFRGGVLHR
jgi:hypothetical protein